MYHFNIKLFYPAIFVKIGNKLKYKIIKFVNLAILQLLRKVVAKPIEVISVMDTKGNITPLRLRIERDDESLQVIKVDKVITRTKEKFAGNLMIVFTCQSLVGDIEKRYELKYELDNHVSGYCTKFRS